MIKYDFEDEILDKPNLEVVSDGGLGLTIYDEINEDGRVLIAMMDFKRKTGLRIDVWQAQKIIDKLTSVFGLDSTGSLVESDDPLGR